VVDAAITEGAALLTTIATALRSAGIWTERPGTNVLDSGAPFYDSYACADGNGSRSARSSRNSSRCSASRVHLPECRQRKAQ